MWHTVLLVRADHLLLMCAVRADHLPQQVSRPPCGTPCCSCVLTTIPQQVSRPPCGTLCCSCVLTTFRNRCLGHHVAHCAARAC